MTSAASTTCTSGPDHAFEFERNVTHVHISEGGAAAARAAAKFTCPCGAFELRDPVQPKTCIGCGARQAPDGSLPCGH